MEAFLLTVGLTLLLALVLGEITERPGQPALLGEVLAGVVLGPHLLGLLDPTVPSHCSPPSVPMGRHLREGLGGTLLEVGRTLGRMVPFFAASVVFAWVVAHVSGSLERSVQRGADFLAVMGLVFVFGYAAEVVGMAASIGAFVVELVVGSEERFDSIELRESVVGVDYGLFIPLFSASIGARLNVGLLVVLDTFVVVVVLVGVATKLLGGYLGSRLVGGGHAESVLVGVGLLPKSEVVLAVVGIGLARSIIDGRILPAFLVLTTVTILITPPLLKRVSTRVPTSPG